MRRRRCCRRLRRRWRRAHLRRRRLRPEMRGSRRLHRKVRGRRARGVRRRLVHRRLGRRGRDAWRRGRPRWIRTRRTITITITITERRLGGRTHEGRGSGRRACRGAIRGVRDHDGSIAVVDARAGREPCDATDLPVVRGLVVHGPSRPHEDDTRSSIGPLNDRPRAPVASYVHDPGADSLVVGLDVDVARRRAPPLAGVPGPVGTFRVPVPIDPDGLGRWLLRRLLVDGLGRLGRRAHFLGRVRGDLGRGSGVGLRLGLGRRRLPSFRWRLLIHRLRRGVMRVTAATAAVTADDARGDEQQQDRTFHR